MSRIWSMMDVGKRSLANSQTALQTVAHNVANRATPGYSRQVMKTETNEPIGTGRLRVGMGAKASSIERINNPYLEKQIAKEQMNLGEWKTKAETLGRVEQVFNEQMNKGLNKFMGEMFNAFRELSNNPESLGARTLVKESADFMAKDFHRIHDQLTGIQGDIDFQIASHVSQVNEITKEIAQLNEKVQIVELNGLPANDERDKRDQLIKELGEKINIRHAEGEDGQVTITAGNSAVLVSGYSFRPLEVASTPKAGGKREGNLDIFYKASESGSAYNVTSQIQGGALGGLLEVRDVEINGLIDKMNVMAEKLSTEVNRIHTQGYDRYNQRGVSFFQYGKGGADAAKSIEVNEAIFQDVGRIASAALPNAPGDNRVANLVSGLQYKPVFGEDQSTIDDFYSSLVGTVGIEAARANSSTEAQQGIVKQLTNIRESISGVSLDEETTKMIEFQKSFDASARLIRTADEMMETVLNLKRL